MDLLHYDWSYDRKTVWFWSWVINYQFKLDLPNVVAIGLGIRQFGRRSSFDTVNIDKEDLIVYL